jgi:hypothetical protein
VDCSGGDVTQVRIPEEATHQVWELLQPMQRGQRLGFEVLRAADAGTADPIMLDVLPHPLAWVQLRRIPGQEAQLQPPIGRLSERLDGLGAVHRMAIQARNTGPGLSSSSRRQKSMNTEPFKLPS